MSRGEIKNHPPLWRMKGMPLKMESVNESLDPFLFLAADLSVDGTDKHYDYDDVCLHLF